MESVGELEVGFWDLLEAFQSASMQLAELKAVPDVANGALGLALDLTKSSVAFIGLADETGERRQVFSRASGSADGLAPGDVERLIASARMSSSPIAPAGELSWSRLSDPSVQSQRSYCGQPLTVGGKQIGMIGVASQSGYTAVQRLAFSVFANQVAATLEIAMLKERRQDMVDALVNLRTELDRSEKQRLINEERARSAARVELAHEQLKHAETDLKKTVERLERVDAARLLLLKNVSTAVDKARKRFANELHDDALQRLTAAELQLQRVTDPGGQNSRLLAEAQSLLAQTEDALRRLLFEVRPPALELPGGLAGSIRDRLTLLRSLTGIEAEVDVELSDDFTYELKSMVFRQVAEALTNVEKHASATSVRLSLKMLDGAVHGVVRDNGRGFVVSERDRLPGHLGLLALNERALLAGGWAKIESEPGVGTTIEFWMPVA